MSICFCTLCRREFWTVVLTYMAPILRHAVMSATTSSGVQMDFYQKIQTFSCKPDPITHFTGVLDQPVCSKFTFRFSTNTWDPYITCSDLISKHIHLLVFGWKHAKPHRECCGVNKLIHDEALNGEQVKFVRTQQRRSSMLFVQCTQETWCHCTNMETPTSIGEFNSVLQRHSLGINWPVTDASGKRTWSFQVLASVLLDPKQRLCAASFQCLRQSLQISKKCLWCPQNEERCTCIL